jgi:hypothetical protein
MLASGVTSPKVEVTTVVGFAFSFHPILSFRRYEKSHILAHFYHFYFSAIL